MNEHPKEAMEWKDSERKDDFAGFMKHMHYNFALLGNIFPFFKSRGAFFPKAYFPGLGLCKG